MLRAAQKKATSTRRPWRYRAARTRIKLTNLEKLENKKRRQDQKDRYTARLQEAFGVLMNEAEAMKEEFGKHDTQWYLNEIMQTYRLKQKKKKIAPFQAFISLKMAEINSRESLVCLLPGFVYDGPFAETPEGQPRKKIPECMPAIAEQWAKLSEEEQKAITKDSLMALESNRENRALASHNSSLSAFHDVRTTMEDAKLMLQRLNARTGVESAIFTVRSNSEHFNPPEAWVTSERVASFFELGYKETPHAMATRLEGYCISGVEGVARNYIQETLEMKKEVVKLIHDKLQTAGGKTKIPRMFYKNFDTHITEKYGIKLINWPLDKFCNPSELSARTDVDVLRKAFESNSTYFYKMSSEEYKEWDEKRFEAALAEGQGSGGTERQEQTETPASESASMGNERLEGEGPSPTNPSPIPSTTSTPAPVPSSNSQSMSRDIEKPK
ncbi:hypothetical protein VKT23_014054 [Stygiomarasmius scandens]|uniref:HMG box domain-containing protein n=1 Tax=Marasmiellus scandens TaxID=2682957 RepID=A0ABR1J4P1_9AGAR